MQQSHRNTQHGSMGLLKRACRVAMTVMGSCTLAGSIAGHASTTAIAQPAQQRSASPFADEIPGLEIEFPMEKFDLRVDEANMQYLDATGTIKNVSNASHRLPPLTFVFKTKSEIIVFERDVDVTPNVISPGETIEVNVRINDIPKAAKHADIGWKANPIETAIDAQPHT